MDSVVDGGVACLRIEEVRTSRVGGWRLIFEMFRRGGELELPFAVSAMWELHRPFFIQDLVLPSS